MGLLKLVIVDDEPILLEGLVKTYDWNGMGYEVVGFAQSGEQALKVIREKKPHVVLTDIRMKQISGLMVMEEIKKENPECQFVVLSAYRDFENYYSNMRNLKAAKAVDVCYKILGTAIEKRLENAEKKENKGSKEYIAAAVAYIDEHLDNEDLSIVSVATHVYLNPVYFGRVFKNTFHMTFKQYLLQRRMELAKRLLEDGRTSIGNICEQVGISNPSYFSHLFKEYTGQLPRDYKREYEV